MHTTGLNWATKQKKQKETKQRVGWNFQKSDQEKIMGNFQRTWWPPPLALEFP